MFLDVLMCVFLISNTLARARLAKELERSHESVYRLTKSQLHNKNLHYYPFSLFWGGILYPTMHIVHITRERYRGVSVKALTNPPPLYTVKVCL